MQLKGTTDFERVSHLRCAWHIVSAVRESNKKLTADILDEVTKVRTGSLRLSKTSPFYASLCLKCHFRFVVVVVL